MAEEQNRSWVDRYMLRLPDGMRDRIKAAAEANNRSMNAEIVATLAEKYPAPRLQSSDEELQRRIDALPPEDRTSLLAMIEAIARQLDEEERLAAQSSVGD